MIPTYNPTPLANQYPDDDLDKPVYVAARGSHSPAGSKGTPRHVWFFWENTLSADLDSEARNNFSSNGAEPNTPTNARQIIQLEPLGSSYVYLEPNIILPTSQSTYPFASQEAYAASAGYTSKYTPGEDRVFKLGVFSRDAREVMLTLAADVDIADMGHQKSDSGHSNGFGWKTSVDGGNTGNGVGGVVNASRVWARDFLGNLVENQLIDNQTFLDVVEMVPLPR